MKNRFGRVLVAVGIFLSGGLLAEEQTPLMPLAEVRAGMEGYWRTVVSGTEIRDYPLEVLGVAENFVGPGRSLIICQAIDAENILSGPVAGMSGSPVFIDGKLIGAYAYGFTWAKEQAIIGVTPIADMLELLDRFSDDDERVARGSRFPEPVGLTGDWEKSHSLTGAATGEGGALLPPRDVLQSYLQPLPTALNISGISPGVLSQFEDRFRALGMEPALVPMGRTAREIDTDLQPGSAVAGVLLDGDFNMAGTGTVTYRDGDRILAFGHPFFGMGATELPMAAAEVMTVIRSVRSSFKLSNTGPIIGSIYQDRLTAIAGQIGREAPTTRVTLNVENDNGFHRTYKGNLFKHPQLSPLISTMALAESLTQTMEASSEQTFFIRTTWDIEGYEPIVQEDVSTGPNSPMRLAIQHLNLYNNLSNNFFAAPTVNSITYDISFRDEWLISDLESAFIDRRRAKAGETVTVDVVLRNYRGERITERVQVPVPAHLRSENLVLFVGDAGSSRIYEPAHRAQPTSLEQVLEGARRHRSRQAIYVKLLRHSSGLTVEGRGLSNLLPSVAASLKSPQSQTPTADIAFSTLWEAEIPVAGEFRGRKTFHLEIE